MYRLAFMRICCSVLFTCISVSSFVLNPCSSQSRRQASFRSLAGSSDIPSSSSSSSSSSDDLTYYDTQEILLRLQLCPTQENAFDRLQAFVRSFPFAAALPVQPLTYLPTSDGGVEVKFLRKPTDQKPGVDGGFRIFMIQEGSNSQNKILLTAKRNDRGQTCQKIFAEKLIVTKLLAALNGQDAGLNLKYTGTADCISNAVQVESVYHKWLDAI
jgi:hypothetical protein